MELKKYLLVSDFIWINWLLLDVAFEIELRDVVVSKYLAYIIIKEKEILIYSLLEILK